MQIRSYPFNTKNEQTTPKILCPIRGVNHCIGSDRIVNCGIVAGLTIIYCRCTCMPANKQTLLDKSTKLTQTLPS